MRIRAGSGWPPCRGSSCATRPGWSATSSRGGAGRRRSRSGACAVSPPALARLRRAGVSHIHVHFAAGAALDAMRIASLLRIPYSLTAHAYDIFESPANLREKIERAAFTTTGCEYNRRYLQGLVEPDVAERIHVMVMGVDPEVFRRRTPYPGGRHVMAVGRLVEKKGFAYLVEAIAELEKTAPVDRLTILGEGPLRAELEAAIEQPRARRAGEPAGVGATGRDPGRRSSPPTSSSCRPSWPPTATATRCRWSSRRRWRWRSR